MATEMEQALAVYQALELVRFSEKAPIEVTALVELESDGTRTLHFLGPKGGGIRRSRGRLVGEWLISTRIRA